MRVAYETMLAEFERVLNKYGFSPERAHEAAEIFAQNSLAGVFSHGLNRFPVVVDYLKKGGIDPAATAECIASFGAMERWNGKRGFGPLNARHAMGRAVELAHQYGIGLVALGNNNHWMRGGTYGWQAADAGCIGMGRKGQSPWQQSSHSGCTAHKRRAYHGRLCHEPVQLRQAGDHASGREAAAGGGRL